MSVDRTRRFNLPGIQDLNKDQDEALALPLDGQSLIIGGPGTGKSVVALLRARRLAQKNQSYRFVVYNHLLDQSNRYLFGNERSLVAKTWMSWFCQLWRHVFHDDVPRMASEGNSLFRDIDWLSVVRQIQEMPEGVTVLNNLPFLILDEGQDMPPAFYEALANLGFENFYVVADQNQQLHPDKCSSRQDIENALAIETKDTLELRTNYRNTRSIALLARHFYTGDPASPPPDLPPQNSPLIPLLVDYGHSEGRSLERIADRILQRSDQNPRKLIGIITPNNEVRGKFYNALTQANPPLDNDKPPIQTFVSGRQQTLDFGHGGIMVINAQSCKGLEFDTVILADIDRHEPKHDKHALKSRFYVMVTRARDQVILLRSGSVCSVVNGLLPTDSNILSRK